MRDGPPAAASSADHAREARLEGRAALKAWLP